MRHISNGPCPSCGSRDNLGHWDDGHAYCFGCGYYEPPTNSHITKSYKDKHEQQELQLENTATAVFLPDDSDSYIPAQALLWLASYGVTRNELISNKVLWSESWSRLIFPYFSTTGGLLAWQGRYIEIGRNLRHPPKWSGLGNLKTVYNVIPKRSSYKRIILVEDIISAILVSRQTPAMALCGSQIGFERFLGLKRLTPRVTLWLDYDKRSEAILERSRATAIGLECDIIITKEDPKGLSDEKRRAMVH